MKLVFSTIALILSGVFAGCASAPEPGLEAARRMILDGRAECVLVKDGRILAQESGGGVSPGSQKRRATAARDIPAPTLYEFIPLVAKPKVGMPVRSSMTRAIPLKSVPIIIGIGVPASAMKRGRSSSAARQTSPINFSSSPISASTSASAEMNTSEGMSYQRGSSCVL